MATILVVDDSPVCRTMIADALREIGHKVLQAADGQQGIAAYEAHRPDCVVTDLLMPGVDGHQLLGHIRGIDGRIPVIVLSADIQSMPFPPARSSMPPVFSTSR